ncbi:hypothetical protein QO002_005190 [Pararhizobium capsulatum DSM 1112]|uniref:Uncharacterized protein n=1 Tax=Pararhizobium capsulatum DSM 1112 TaxID=1121113 RepID=A0ABU0BXK5_9HYPH|nr:hypothetical protein [Pararhizobium capsulatum]MDQ0322984.1 hypothetical protein [Pararhizobium capsulatum DSM 1112]
MSCAVNNDGVETGPRPPSTFVSALEMMLEGYCEGRFEGHPWSVTVKRSNDGKRIWLYGKELGGKDTVSFNLYRLSKTGPLLKPCEMSSSKVIDFVLGFEREPPV